VFRIPVFGAHVARLFWRCPVRCCGIRSGGWRWLWLGHQGIGTTGQMRQAFHIGGFVFARLLFQIFPYGGRRQATAAASRRIMTPPPWATPTIGRWMGTEERKAVDRGRKKEQPREKRRATQHGLAAQKKMRKKVGVRECRSRSNQSAERWCQRRSSTRHEVQIELLQ
jgi:hypothetical protein